MAADLTQLSYYSLYTGQYGTKMICQDGSGTIKMEGSIPPSSQYTNSIFIRLGLPAEGNIKDPDYKPPIFIPNSEIYIMAAAESPNNPNRYYNILDYPRAFSIGTSLGNTPVTVGIYKFRSADDIPTLYSIFFRVTNTDAVNTMTLTPMNIYYKYWGIHNS